MLIGREFIEQQLSYQATCSFSEKVLGFSNGVAKMIGLTKDDTSKFFFLEKLSMASWLFIVNEDEQGFPIHNYMNVNRGFRIFNKGLIAYMRKETPSIMLNEKYYVSIDRGVLLEGRQAYEILIDKPLSKIGK